LLRGGKMSTRISSAERQIRDLCRFLEYDEAAVYRRGLQILKKYNQIRQADSLVNHSDTEEDYQEQSELRTAAAALRECFFVSDSEGDASFWKNAHVLMDRKWMLDLTDRAIIYVQTNRIDHQDYYQLIRYKFLDQLSEIDICEFMGLQRTAMYMRRREAVTMFGIGFLKALDDFLRYPQKATG